MGESERIGFRKSFDHTLLSFYSHPVSKKASVLPVHRFLASHMDMESQRPVCARACVCVRAHAHTCVYKHMPVFYSKLKRKKKVPQIFQFL